MLIMPNLCVIDMRVSATKFPLGFCKINQAKVTLGANYNVEMSLDCSFFDNDSGRIVNFNENYDRMIIDIFLA